MGAGSAHVTRSAGTLARATLDNGTGWMPTDPPIVGDNRTQVNAGAGRGDDAEACGTTIPGPHKQKRPGETRPSSQHCGGRYRVRTCDPYHVKVVLYR